MRRLIWLPVAGFLLVAGAAVGAAAPAAVDEATDTIVAPIHRAGAFLQGVLDELVGEGVINEEQSDAIVNRVDQRVEEKRAELEARREELAQLREQLRTFLEDDVITQQELEQLPADHPLRNLDSFLDDGQITRQELQQLGRWGGLGRGWGPGGHSHQRGPGWLEVSPAPDDAEQAAPDDAASGD